MSLDTTSTNPLRGGTITVDGIVITIPTNLLVTLPAITVAWPELFSGTSPPGIRLEAHVYTIYFFLLISLLKSVQVQGNLVGATNIAGLVYISPSFTQILQGFITGINTASGHFTISSSNIDCVLNDPVGRFGKPQTGQELWSSDPDNPSIRATNGFPLCIPRTATDDHCPSKNRPLDANGKAQSTLSVKHNNGCLSSLRLT